MVSTLPGGGGDDSSILSLLPQCSRALSHPTALMVACKLRTVPASNIEAHLIEDLLRSHNIAAVAVDDVSAVGTWWGGSLPMIHHPAIFVDRQPASRLSTWASWTGPWMWVSLRMLNRIRMVRVSRRRP